MKKESLKVPNELGTKASDLIAKALNPLVADAFALYVKTKNYHWHVTGPNFRDYHLLFDEQAEQIFAMIDVLAERVRKLGELTVHSIHEIGNLQTVEDDNDLFVEPEEMIDRLYEENTRLISHLRGAHEVSQGFGDVATTSILETFIDETERRAWFLYSMK